MARPVSARKREGRSPVEERIVEAAVTLFAERGFDATSVQQIVDRAEVTKGALYHYFGSKDDLLFEIYHSLIGVQNADLDAIVARDLNATETLREILVAVVRTTTERVGEAAVFFREAHKLDAERAAAYKADRRRYHEGVLAVVERGQADGEFNPDLPADTAVQVAMGVVNQLPVWYRPGGPKSPDQLGAEIAEFVLAALRPVR